jgi:flagellin-like protein
MKANRKFKEEEAVSAVIGVILMVAITVAIAATVYVYVSGMIGTGQTATPNVQLTTGSKKLTVAKADTGLLWSDFKLTVDNGATITTTFGTWSNGSAGPSAAITAGNAITFSKVTNATMIHTPTNSLVGTWKLT